LAPVFFHLCLLFFLGAWSVAGFIGIDVAIFHFASRANFRAACAYEDTASLDAIQLGAIGFDAVKPPSGAGSLG
jgi:uncharacterized membrane protein